MLTEESGHFSPGWVMGTRIRRTKAERDPEILKTILMIIGLGAGKTAAAAEVGIGEYTLREWIRDGKKAAAERDDVAEFGIEWEPTPKQRLFATFYDDVCAAEERTQVYLLTLMRKAAKGDWKAAAWLLEKLYPEKFGWGLKVDVKVDKELGDFLTRLEDGLPPEVFERVLRVAHEEPGGETIEVGRLTEGGAG